MQTIIALIALALLASPTAAESPRVISLVPTTPRTISFVSFEAINPMPVPSPNRYEPAVILDPSMQIQRQPMVLPFERQLWNQYPQNFRMRNGVLEQKRCNNGYCTWHPVRGLQ